MEAGDQIRVEEAHWRGTKSVTLINGRASLRPGQVRVLRITHKDGAGYSTDKDTATVTLAIVPRPTLQALRLDVPEGTLRNALVNQGHLTTDGSTHHARTQLRLHGPLGQDEGRLTGWLIQESPGLSS
jgi:hypothetical protein